MPLSLDDYLAEYAPALAANSHNTLDPLHVPNRDPVAEGIGGLGRKLYEAQEHVVSAAVKHFQKARALIVCGQCGCGKSAMAAAIFHLLSKGKPYRGIIMCPAHIAEKWEVDELPETLGGVKVHRVKRWSDLIDLAKAGHPTQAEWWVIGRDRCKLGAVWKAAYMRRPNLAGKAETALCSHCGHSICDEKGQPIDLRALEDKKHYCVGCGEALWTYTRDVDRWAPAKFIKKFLRFDYFIADEAHELAASTTSAQSVAFHALAGASRKVIAMTGTLTGGSAEHIRPLLFRLFPHLMKQDGWDWEGAMPFSREYGRVETTYRQKDGGGRDNRMSSGRTKTVKCVPGIMPSLFGRLLIGNVVFLTLDQVAEGLPDYEEHVLPVQMSPQVQTEYERIERELRDAVSEMLAKGDKRLLSAMLHTLLTYPDHTTGWGPVGFKDNFGGNEFFVPVCEPANLDQSASYPKEADLIQLCKAERMAGRQVWVYVQNTGEHDVSARLEQVLTKAGLKVGVLRASVTPEKRRAWLFKNGPNMDVGISHAKLVETGVDFFDKKGRTFNFCTLIFMQTGYMPNVLRQAAARAMRLAQWMPCKVYFAYYKGTMAERAMALMGRKLVAAESLEGKFSTEGLVAMSDGDSMEVALAKSLVQNMPENAALAWGKATSGRAA